MKISTITGGQLTANQSRAFQDFASSKKDFYFEKVGTGLTITANNLEINIGTGLIMACGTLIEVDKIETLTIPTPATPGTARLILKVDLSEAIASFYIKTNTESLIDNDLVQLDNGLREIEIATVNYTTTKITSLSKTLLSTSDFKQNIDNIKYAVERNPSYPGFETSGLKWEKFNDGTIEMEYQKTHSLSFSSAWGSFPIYQTPSSSDGTTISIAPGGFVSVDNIQISAKNNVDNKVILPTLQATSNAAINVTYACGYTTAVVSRSATIYASVSGRWK